MPERLYFTESDDANALIASDPMALLVGFALDQQVTVQKAFAGPLAIRERLGSLDAGILEEFTLRTDVLTLMVRVLTPEYFLACAIMPQGGLGRARYLMRVAAPALRADL